MTNEQTSSPDNGQSFGQVNREKSGFLAAPRQDALASVVVFLVALPLCMGIAIASGVPVAAGLITGIVGGIVAGLLAGCPLQVSGPAAGLTVIVFEIVQRFGLEMLGVIVLIGGLIQITASVLKLGQWFRAVSPAVIKGMLAGIGVLILASQFHVMVDDKPKGSGIQNLITIPQAIWKGLALPEFNSRQVRQFRTEMLRSVGELHRRQINLHERLAEHAPHHDNREGSPEYLSSNKGVGQGDLSEVTTDQTGITQALIVVGNRLQDFETQGGDGERTRKTREAATAAVRNSEAALAALQQGNVAEILPLQADAVASLEALLDQQKNHQLAAQLGILTIVVILLWQGFASKQLKVIPAPLVAVVLATLVAAVLAIPVFYVEVPNNLWSEVRFPNLTAYQLRPGAPYRKPRC